MLSLGGDSKDYQLTGAAAGIQFADFLWGAYGPLTSAWKVILSPSLLFTIVRTKLI